MGREFMRSGRRQPAFRMNVLHLRFFKVPPES